MTRPRVQYRLRRPLTKGGYIPHNHLHRPSMPATHTRWIPFARTRAVINHERKFTMNAISQLAPFRRCFGGVAEVEQ